MTAVYSSEMVVTTGMVPQFTRPQSTFSLMSEPHIPQRGSAQKELDSTSTKFWKTTGKHLKIQILA
jgi:hypothetical protein